MLRFHLPENMTLVHESVIPVRWGDMDAMGHVNNTLYLRYFEIVRLDWLATLGLRLMADGGEGPVIVNVFCNFLRQLEFPGEVRARHYVAHVGRSSFDTYATLERTDEPGVHYAECGAKAVWTNFAARKSLPLPDWMRERLAAGG